MDNAPAEFFFAAVLVAILVGLAGYFAWRQWQTLRSLRSQPELPQDERRYQRTLAWRRITCSALLLVLAVMLGGAYLFGIEGQAKQLAQTREVAGREEPPPLNAEQKRFLNFYSLYWIILMLVLLGVVCLAFADLWAIRRFGLRQYRQIQADRRAMIEHQVARMRIQRNGHH